MAETRRQGPLSHVRVLDLSRIMAGPWATQILADLGADVIKVERPEAGDDTRAWGPPYLKDAAGNPTSEAGYYLSVNRGKRSITVDITSAKGQDVIRRLAARSDIVVENYKVGTLTRYGLDYAALKAINPRLIFASVTGFGQSGPRKSAAAYDFAIQAMGGLMSVTGEREGMPGAGPQKVGVPIVDIMTGMYTAVGVLAALVRRNETGKGDNIDLAMLDVQTGFLANQAMNWLVSGRAPVRGGNRHPNIQPQDVFPCADGFVVLAVGNDGQFAKLCEALGEAQWAQDARFATNPARVTYRETLIPLVQAALVARPTADWLDRFQHAGIPAGKVNTVGEALAHPSAVARNMVVAVPHPTAGEVRLVNSPLRLSATPTAVRRPPPLLGEHTAEVLVELGYSEEQIVELCSDGVIR